MPNEGRLNLTVTWIFDTDAVPHAFGALRQMLGAIADIGVVPDVEVVGVNSHDDKPTTDPPSASPPARRSRKGQGQKLDKDAPAPDLGLGTEDDAEEDGDDLGLGVTEPSSRSGAEAKEEARNLVNGLWNAGHKKEVKALQAKLGVVKFYDVPEQDGHKFYKLALELAEKVGHQK